MNVSRSSLLPYTVEQMYDVIADVRSYPAFLNWCTDMEIVSENGNDIVAKLLISYGRLDFGFTTRNTMCLNESVAINLVDGPFSSLAGQWHLQKLNDSACKVSLEMEFSFDSVVTQALFGRLFQGVIVAQLSAFQRRAEQLYGPQSLVN